jgi:hypothetical protein
VLQVHYRTNGFPARDQSKIGLVFASERPKFRELTLSAANDRFKIPAGDPAYEVKSRFTLQAGTELVSLMPHMHLRGKDFLYRVVYPGGDSETILSVPRYDFSWQLVYSLAKPIALPKGTRIECIAHFDNSANNKLNPNPSIEVGWGDQSREEMMIGFFDVIIPAGMDPASLHRAPTGE